VVAGLTAKGWRGAIFIMRHAARIETMPNDRARVVGLSRTGETPALRPEHGERTEDAPIRPALLPSGVGADNRRKKSGRG
jgi:hypothetical protein